MPLQKPAEDLSDKGGFYMKVKRLLMGFVLALFSVATVFAVAGCADDSDKDSSGGTSGGTDPAGKTYQFVGVMDDADLANYGMQCTLWLKLNADGTAAMDKYSHLTYNDAPAAENSAYQADYMTGTWEESVKDGVTGISISVASYNDDGEAVDSASGTAYKRGSSYSVTLDLPIMPGLGSFAPRAVDFEGQEGALYENADEFIQENVAVFTPPASVTTFTSDNGGTVYIQEGGTLLVYSGYNQVAEGAYANDAAGNMTVTIGTETIPVTVDTGADTASFSYEYVIYGDYSVTFDLTCGSYSDIPEAAAQETPDNVYTGSASLGAVILTLDDETNATVDYMNGGFVYHCTYVREGDVITLTWIKEDGQGSYSEMMWPSLDQWTLNDEDHTMTAIADEEAV